MMTLLTLYLIAKLSSGPEVVFLVPDLEKETKKHISDKDRRSELLSVYKEANKEIKAFNKRNEKATKSLKKLAASKESTYEEIRQVLTNAMDDRKQHQSSIIEKRLIVQELHTNDEWTYVTENAVSPTAKMEKKENKAGTKEDKEIEKKVARVKDVIEFEVTDPERQKAIAAAWVRFLQDVDERRAKANTISFKNDEVTRDKNASREELQALYDDKNAFREDVYQSFATFYKTARENTTEDEWNRMRNAIKKIFD